MLLKYDGLYRSTDFQSTVHATGQVKWLVNWTKNSEWYDLLLLVDFRVDRESHFSLGRQVERFLELNMNVQR